jgi:hypothetical protein
MLRPPSTEKPIPDQDRLGIDPAIQRDGLPDSPIQPGHFRDTLIHVKLKGDCRQFPPALRTHCGSAFVIVITLLARPITHAGSLAHNQGLSLNRTTLQGIAADFFFEDFL